MDEGPLSHEKKLCYFSSAALSVAFENLDNFPFLICEQLFTSGFNQYQVLDNDGYLVGRETAARVDMIFIVSPAIPILAKFKQKIGRQLRCLGY